jgi:hypothetical protein
VPRPGARRGARPPHPTNRTTSVRALPIDVFQKLGKRPHRSVSIPDSCGGAGSSRVTAEEPRTGSAEVLTTGTGGGDVGVTIRTGPGVLAALLRRSSTRTRGRGMAIVQNGEKRGDSRANRRSPFDLWKCLRDLKEDPVNNVTKAKTVVPSLVGFC